MYDDPNTELLNRELQREALNQLPPEIEDAWDSETKRYERFLHRVLFIIAAFVVLVLLAVSFANCQSISPVISEYHGSKARGEFSIQNNTAGPFQAVVYASSFNVDSAGNPHYRPLDPTIHLKIDSQRTMVGARQQHVFFYEATCDAQPCWFTLYAMVAAGHTANGMQVAISLPHTVYLCSKERQCRTHVRKDLWGLAQ